MDEHTDREPLAPLWYRFVGMMLICFVIYLLGGEDISYFCVPMLVMSSLNLVKEICYV